MAAHLVFIRHRVDAFDHEADEAVALAPTRAITATPSMRVVPGWTPNWGASCSMWAASAAAIRSLLGMQPTRAHVVPYTPRSISTVRAPCAFAAR